MGWWRKVPAAFFIQSDSMAIGAYKAINEAGLSIPKDISIIAFNDIPIAKYMSPLSKDTPTGQISLKIFRMVICLIWART